MTKSVNLIIYTFSLCTLISLSASLDISVFSNFVNSNDKTFFKTTLPWLIDNIGPELRIKFHFLDSGRTSGPRMCALEQIKNNLYLQTSYLKCEAKSLKLEECLKKIPLDVRSFDRCQKRKVNAHVKAAEREYNRLKIDKLPVIVSSRRKLIENLDAKDLLKIICEQFSRNRKPYRCSYPLPLPAQNTDANETSTNKTEVTIPTPEDEKVTPQPAANVTSNEITTSGTDNIPTEASNDTKEDNNDKSDSKNGTAEDSENTTKVNNENPERENGSADGDNKGNPEGKKNPTETSEDTTKVTNEKLEGKNI